MKTANDETSRPKINPARPMMLVRKRRLNVLNIVAGNRLKWCAVQKEKEKKKKKKKEERNAAALAAVAVFAACAVSGVLCAVTRQRNFSGTN